MTSAQMPSRSLSMTRELSSNSSGGPVDYISGTTPLLPPGTPSLVDPLALHFSPSKPCNMFFMRPVSPHSPPTSDSATPDDSHQSRRPCGGNLRNYQQGASRNSEVPSNALNTEYLTTSSRAGSYSGCKSSSFSPQWNTPDGSVGSSTGPSGTAGSPPSIYGISKDGLHNHRWRPNQGIFYGQESRSPEMPCYRTDVPLEPALELRPSFSSSASLISHFPVSPPQGCWPPPLSYPPTATSVQPQPQTRPFYISHHPRPHANTQSSAWTPQTAVWSALNNMQIRLEAMERTIDRQSRELVSLKLAAATSPTMFLGASRIDKRDGEARFEHRQSAVPSHAFVGPGLPNGARSSMESSSADVASSPSCLEGTEAHYEHLVRRIVDHNDQAASVFLQHKYKQAIGAVGGIGQQSVEGEAASILPRQVVTQVVIHHALELMTNRFGNFLVSRVIEHATLAEREALTETIRGHVLRLASDTFAMHCLQKMIDVDSEPTARDEAFSRRARGAASVPPGEVGLRAVVTTELLNNADQCVTHRTAGHVMAKLLTSAATRATAELGVALAYKLEGKWARIAKDEVGSLIVQSTLENFKNADNCLIMAELLEDLKACATHQWSNFVVLHLIEHSTGPARDALLTKLFDPWMACELSRDAFGAKAMEKALKVVGMGGGWVEEYVTAICEPGHGRPALIDIACHQAGAQILTLLFTTAPVSLKEMMIQCVRRHGVSLKSSKIGTKIWFLVERTRAWVGH